MGQAGPVTPDVERDVDYDEWFPGVQGTLVGKEEAREELDESGHALTRRGL